MNSDDVAGWPHNQLERELGKAIREPANFPALWTTLLTMELIVPAQHLPEWGEGVVTFSSTEVLTLSSQSAAKHSVATGRSLLEAAVARGFVLNPCGPYPITLSPREVRSLLAGLAPIGGSETISIGEVLASYGRLADEPKELIEALTTACKKDSSIKAVYLSGILVHGEGESLPHPLIGIDAESYESTRNSFVTIIETWTKRSNQLVDVVDMRTDGPLQKHLQKKGRVLHRRGHGLFRWLFSK